MITEKNNSTAVQSDTSETATPEQIMKRVRRGSDPIPGILPLVGLGLPEGRETYTKDDLVKLREMGLNVMSANFPVPVRMEWGAGGLKFVYKADDANVANAVAEGEAEGMRIIPGTAYSLSGVEASSLPFQTVLAWSKLTGVYKNKLGCPAWMLNTEVSLERADTVAAMASSILSGDQWLKPVMFPLLPISSTIADFGGDAEDGWTEENKFSRYLDALDEKCWPSVLWTSQKAFTTPLGNLPINSKFLKELALVRDRAYRSHRAMWSTVHCTVAAQYPYTSYTESMLPAEVFAPYVERMKTEAHVALAMGARGLVFDSVCGDAKRTWYPARDPEVDNPFGQYLKEMNAEIQKVSEAFLNTYVEYSYMVNGTQKEMLPAGTVESEKYQLDLMSQVSSDPTLSEPFLVSRIMNPNGRTEYTVVVNLGTHEQRFRGELQNTDPSSLLRPLNPRQVYEVQYNRLFDFTLEPGGWRVFSRECTWEEMGF